MGHIVSLDKHPKRLRELRFIREFDSYLSHVGHRARGLPRHASHRMARCAFRGSEQGKDWSLASPIDLVCAAMPSRWTLLSSDMAVQLALRFNEFLVVTQRQSSQEAAFLDGWIRAAQVPLLRELIQKTTDE